MDDSICRENKSLIAALVPFYPAAANAEIKREEKDGTMIVKVTKKAGTKGTFAPVLQSLDAAPETISPILAIQAAPPPSLTTAELDRVLLETIEAGAAIERVVHRLDAAESQPADLLPKGF